MSKTMNIGIDHGYYAIKTRHFSFPAGIAEYSHEPYTLQNTLEFGGKFYVCGTGRQPILRNKMENDNYYLLTLAAIAKEIKQRGGKTECSVRIAAGLPLAGFGREKKPFREYLLRSSQPVCFKFEGIAYKITIEDVKLFPQGYSAIALHSELIQNEPSVLLMDIGGWTVDLMRLDNGVPNAATCRSLELGMIRCIDETKEQVRRDTGLSVTDAQVERVLTGKPCSMDEDARNIIQKQGRLYKESLLSAAMESGFDLKAIPVVMLGGGASVVKGNVSEQDGLCRVFVLIADLRQKGHIVLMVGDGINDSPALSEADAGIAISDGAAIAREIADITIAADSLWELVKLRRIAMALMERIHSNYRFVIGFNGTLIGLGLAGILPPAASAALHNLSTLGVSLRSMSALPEPKQDNDRCI